jgi:glyoxylase-like metal-dependent hydrolase (beta-lactamase superfamily II)
MIQYRILKTGFFTVEGSAMFGAIPKQAWRRRYKSDNEWNCLLAMNCLLVWNENRVVLLDTGIGSKELGKLSYYKFNHLQNLEDLIRLCGFEPEQITDVVLSHLHFDHCGACTHLKEGQLEITFPKAQHWVSRSQWESYLNPNELERKSFRKQDMMPVRKSGLIRLIEDDYELFDGFKMSIFNGHTKGQIISFIKLGEKATLIFPGDVIPTKANFPDTWISAYDIEPLESLCAKKALKKRTKGECVNYVFYHDAYEAETIFSS